ncbi:MAG: holin family protein [Gammaproteobacteria bacterium]
MSWFSRIFSGSLGSLVEQVGNVVDNFHLSAEEKQQFKLELEALLQRRDSEIEQTLRSELEAKERILVAELEQGDSFTKRARPTVVYAGLGFIFFNYGLVPALAWLSGAEVAPLELPSEFWWGWSGIVATWSVGRSLERMGAHNRFTHVATGSPASRLFGDELAKG